MKTSILKICLLGLLAGGIAGTSAQLRAQDTNRTAAEKKQGKSRQTSVTPFHGHLKSVDTAAQTISVGTVTIQITAETKIDKAGKPATLQEGAVGELVSGGYTKSGDGKCLATSLHLGPKELHGHPKKNASETETN